MSNRELKFRAWDIKENKMVDIISMSWRINAGCTDKKPSHIFVERYSVSFHGETDSEVYNDISDRFILMQYVGLKDKNGNEIYEGDIDQDGGMVFYNEGMASFQINYGYYIDIADMEDVSEWMIISGNIYENPELLK